MVTKLNNKQTRHWNNKLHRMKNKYVLTYSIFDKDNYILKNDCKFLVSAHKISSASLDEPELKECLLQSVIGEEENKKYFKNVSEKDVPNRVTLHSLFPLPEYDLKNPPKFEEYFITFYKKDQAEKTDEELLLMKFNFESMIVQDSNDLEKLVSIIRQYIQEHYKISDPILVGIKATGPSAMSAVETAVSCV